MLATRMPLPHCSTGPYQAGTGKATIAFEYHPEGRAAQGCASAAGAGCAGAAPYAITRHNDRYRSKTDTIDTVLITDGLKRVLQTKKVSRPTVRSSFLVRIPLIFQHSAC